jgi:hypothetical protein
MTGSGAGWGVPPPGRFGLCCVPPDPHCGSLRQSRCSGECRTDTLCERDRKKLIEDVAPEIQRGRGPNKLIPRCHGVLLKNEQDVRQFERLAFTARRESR